MTSSMENPSYAGAAPEEQEARGAAEELEVEPERGASPEAASAEGGALVRGLSFALRLLGSNSRGQFLFIQALLVLNVFCHTIMDVFADKYRDKAGDPQRVYLAGMHSFQIWNFLIWDAALVYYHRVLVDRWNTGTIARLLDVPTVSDRPSAVAKVANAVRSGIGSFLLFQACLMAFFWTTIFFFMFIPLVVAGPNEIDEPPFSSNWTVDLHASDCLFKAVALPDHSSGQYGNATQAEQACLQLGDACGGVGAVECNAEGPFYLCDSSWRSISMDGPACTASPPSKLEWLEDTTDPFPLSRYTLLVLPGLVVFPGALLLGALIPNMMALSYVLVCGAALTHIQSGIDTLKSIDKKDPQACNVAMGVLVRLENDVIAPINALWGVPISMCFVLAFTTAIYYSCTITLSIDSGPTAFVYLANGLGSLIGAHVYMLPAALATKKCVGLMGAINGLRWQHDEDGKVAIANDALIIQAECLSTVSRICRRIVIRRPDDDATDSVCLFAVCP